ncbi:MAG: hypothetical protein MK085_02300 [Phycisphaerales bacterium]|nr:hypothetical protein [Phycisphaerales bacterium]
MPACNEKCFFEKKLITGFQKRHRKDKERGPLASMTKNLPGDRRRVKAWNQAAQTDIWQSYLQATGESPRDGNVSGFNYGVNGILGPYLLPAGTKLWRLGGDNIKTRIESDGNMSPWWCAQHRTGFPMNQQSEGLKEAMENAIFNGIPLDMYARIASCVKLEFNTLDNLQMCELRQPAYALWGKFRPLPLTSLYNSNVREDRDGRPVYRDTEETAPGKVRRNNEIMQQMHRGGYQQHGDHMLGGLEAYQLWIPSLKGRHLTSARNIPANDEGQIRHVLGIGPKVQPSPKHYLTRHTAHL